ncbi:hypothetical protein CEXT_308871 [Caerostris extrusa]|uniref:Uncharacterized protein n=1 Tax=Caerostris extrusa TaxID=172846 RepID=A0AAV4TYI3_CAEEX|nr:hypothetical protein CEXT_308871 [Caerostris extrusa]
MLEHDQYFFMVITKRPCFLTNSWKQHMRCLEYRTGMLKDLTQRPSQVVWSVCSFFSCLLIVSVSSWSRAPPEFCNDLAQMLLLNQCNSSNNLHIVASQKIYLKRNKTAIISKALGFGESEQ